MRSRSAGKWWGVVLEAPDGPALARFYSQLLDWPITHEEERYAVIAPAEPGSYLGFSTSEHFVPPVWPVEAGEQRMMMHVDVEVDDLDAAVAEAVALGATLATSQFQDTVRVLIDPVGHPFCLYVDATP